MKRVIIIGAGPAGLTAGYTLLKKSSEYEVTILEAENYIGGISRTVDHNGNKMDIGGHRFFSKVPEINEFWKEMLGEDLLFCKRSSSIFYNNKTFSYPIELSLETLKNLGISESIKSGFSYTYSKLKKRSENSLEDLYINKFGKELYSIFFEGYTEKIWGIHPKYIDPLWGEQRVKGVDILEVIKNALGKKSNETSLIDTFLYPKFGSGEMWEKVAEEFKKSGGKILLENNVLNIETEDNNIRRVICENGCSYECDYVLSSASIKDLVSGIKNAPESVTKIANELPYRDFIIISFLVDKKYINSENYDKIKDDCWVYIQDKNLKMGRIQIFNNWSSGLIKNKNYLWLGMEYFCNENDNLWKMNNDEFSEIAFGELKKSGIINLNAKVEDFYIERQKKAYPAYFGTYKNISEVINYLNSIENLYCIGRNGQHKYNNMDHSMLTGIEASKCILNNSKDKRQLWNVNTETNYIESKKT